MQSYVTLIRAGALVGGLLLLGPARAPMPADPPVATPRVYLATSFGSAAISSSPPAVLGTRSLLGASVTTADGSHLGWLEDLVIDPTDAQITLVIVAVSGRFGFGSRFVVLPWSMMQPASNGLTGVVASEPTHLQHPLP